MRLQKELEELFHSERQVLTTGTRSDGQSNRVSQVERHADKIIDGWNTPISELTALRGQEFNAMDEIIRTAEEDGGRNYTEEEKAEYDEHKFIYEALHRAIKHQPYTAGATVPKPVLGNTGGSDGNPWESSEYETDGQLRSRSAVSATPLRVALPACRPLY